MPAVCRQLHVCVGFQFFTARIVHIGMFWENVLLQFRDDCEDGGTVFL